MVKISGWVFVGIGLLFSGMSYYINFAQKTNSMTIFLYLGYLFLAYGIAKVLVNYIMRRDKSEKNANKQLPESNDIKWHRNNDTKNKTHAKQNQASNTNRNNLNQPQNQNNPSNSNPKDMNGYIGYCPRCGTPMRNVNSYCHRCGMKQE